MRLAVTLLAALMASAIIIGTKFTRCSTSKSCGERFHIGMLDCGFGLISSFKK